MEEVIFLFLYHKLDEVTQRHYDMLQRFHPRDQIVPVAYQLKLQEVLPGSVDVALDGDYGLPIKSTWHEIDKIYLRWFLNPNRPGARRYVFYEYDILPRVSAEAFYGDAWNADIAAVDIKSGRSDPRWIWWAHCSRLRKAYKFRQGLSPLSGTLWSDETLQRIAQRREFQDCYCELRMGTLVNVVGMKALMIPGAARTFACSAEEIVVTDEPTWFHPVKS